MRTVRVEWKGPLFLDEVKDLDDEDEDCGLYQIYGRHIIFGDDSLLYIGMTQQTFSHRFDQHAGWLEEEEGVFVYVGRINKENYDGADRQQVIEDTEALTINWHSPPYNSSNIDTYNGQALEVINDGERGDLCERLSAGDKMTFLLQVFEVEELEKETVVDSSYVVQSEVFEVTGNTKDRILQKARKTALNNVLREDLRDLFEKQRWKTEDIFGRFYTCRAYEKGKYRALLLITDPSNDATTLLYQLWQPLQRRHV